MIDIIAARHPEPHSENSHKSNHRGIFGFHVFRNRELCPIDIKNGKKHDQMINQNNPECTIICIETFSEIAGADRNSKVNKFKNSQRNQYDSKS